MKILFLHGWTSVPGGRKPTYLKEHGHTVLNRALPDDDFDEAVRIAQAEFNQHKLDCRWFACPLLFRQFGDGLQQSWRCVA